MERHRLHGTIHPDSARPEPGLIQRFAAHDTAKVADSMPGYGVAHHEIKGKRVAEVFGLAPKLAVWESEEH